MSWHYSQALAAAYSAATSSGGAPSAPSRSIPTLQPSLPPGKMTARSRRSRFGMMFAALTDDRGEALLTWYREVSRVRTSARPGEVPESTANAPDSGEICVALSVRYIPNSRSWKTHRLLWDEVLPECSVILPASGMMRHGVCWELILSDYPTTEPDYGWLPTVRACCATHGIAWGRAERGDHKYNIEDYLAYLYVNAGGQRVRGMSVSASFAALIMGWPQRWTSLEPLATDRFRSWLRLHSAALQAF